MVTPCADCSKAYDYNEMYFVTPPSSRRPQFWLCAECWDRLVGVATMEAIR